jgi:glyoxylate/hydroxypyruvate reductase A
MAVLLVAHATFPEVWRNAFTEAFRDEGLFIWPDIANLHDVDCVIVARSEPGVLAKLPNLKLISSTGMGVDHILGLADLPPQVPLARVVTAEMIDQVAEYVTLAVLRVERDDDHFDRLQVERKWQRRMTRRTGGKLRVGLLGWGVIAREIARRLSFLGFPVAAWARSGRTDGPIVVHAGTDGLHRMLTASNILVNALPGTEATRDLLDAENLGRLPPGAHVINVGRGEHLVDTSLIDLLDRGHLAGATLDVFRTEPLPQDHPFWLHPKVRVTPHSAGMLTPRDSAAAILDNLRRVRAGQPPRHRVDITLGY